MENLNTPMTVQGMSRDRILPSPVLARYVQTHLLYEALPEEGVMGGRALPRIFAPLTKAQEVLRRHGLYGVLIEEEHALFWYLSQRPSTPPERALEEIRWILHWRMVQPGVSEAVLQDLQTAFSTRPRFWERLQELLALRRDLETWLVDERMDLARLYGEAARLADPGEAILQAFEDRYLPAALQRFLSRYVQQTAPPPSPPSPRTVRTFARTEAEAHAVARHLRRIPPRHPHRTVIALGDSRLLALYERVLKDYGIPFVRSGGPRLTSFPEFHLIDAVVAYLEYLPDPPPEIIERIGKEPALRDLLPPPNEAGTLPASLQTLLRTLGPHFRHGGDRLPVSRWILLLETFLREGSRAPLSSQHAEVQERLRRMLEEMRFAVEVGGDPSLPPRAFRLLLHRFARKFRVPEDETGHGIWLVSLEDIPPEGERLYVVALSEQAFPRYPYHPWIPLRHAERFGWPSPPALYPRMVRRFFRNLQGYTEVWLSYSRLDAEDREMAPSPILIPFLSERVSPGEPPARFLPWEGKVLPSPEFSPEGQTLEGPALQKWRTRLLQEGLRTTDLVTYRRCPFRFYLQVVEQIPDRRPPEALPTALDTGKLFHEAYEQALRPLIGKPLPPPETLVQRVRDVLSRILPSGESLIRIILEEEMEVLLKGMEELEAILQGMGFLRLVSVEASGVCTVEGVRIRGRWDRIMEGEDGAVVVDYKTGRYPASNHEQEALTLQLEAYRRMRPNVVTAMFLYPRSGRYLVPSLTFPKDPVLEEIIQAIQEGQFPTTEHPETVCRSCPFSRICPVGREHGG